ncbi:uncharacterized protein LOC109536799 isoform X1 [Dendroctonus ponderosae]|uniref:uncharacterized protein LOC109536799 isoform X1 n=1 Tax=Dendroctonus ponderosae TaxID=77166 RepID=UPI0020359686|nr:uncharacterized protein LOC109536799 isoform X1 [Dendroctonus ponderosae]KAH1025528.1 hypothetical protein HUJ05_010236 [Dendroctonus ponderosae]
MDDFDLKCLPLDFVGQSRPSKVIEALYEKKAAEEKRAIKILHKSKQDICDKYDRLFKEQSTELKHGLHEIRGLIKNELFDSKIKSNHDNANYMEKHNFKNIYKRIYDYTKQQDGLVESFYSNSVKLEKEKSKEFSDALKIFYQEIKRISNRLPHECDEQIQMELKNVNETILCNNRNYIELKCQLQAEIQNYARNAIQELRHIKDCWIKFLRSQSEYALGNLKKQYTPALSETIQTLQDKTKELADNLRTVDLTSVEQDPSKWLNNLRQTLANVDQRAQKIIINYKQAAVLIYNRCFNELHVIEEALREMSNAEAIPEDQTEMYTPALEDIRTLYDVEIDTIQTAWNKLVDKLTKTIDNTYNFLNAATILWQKHFRRTEVLQLIMLKDMENMVKLNNTLTEPYETKMNILIDTLRQEASKEKTHKTMGEVMKLLSVIEGLYMNQYQSEVAVPKKYKNLLELKVDILIEEVKRFLEVYPPDKEKDPKIQRKRASQTSEIADPNDNLIPNQMLYCEFQIGAISNWQFGLWECIGNYVETAKTEIMKETDQWIQKHIIRMGKRKDIRLNIHGMRLRSIEAYIYKERLEELCIHESRLAEHKNAVERRIPTLNDMLRSLQDSFDTITKDYYNAIQAFERKSLESMNSCAVASLKPILNGKTETTEEKIDLLAQDYLSKCNTFANSIKSSHVAFLENIKLFYDGGSFSAAEVKNVIKELAKIEAQVEKTVTNVRKDVESNKTQTLAKVQLKSNEFNSTLNTIIDEHKFVEILQKKQKVVQRALLTEVCTVAQKRKTLNDKCEKFKLEMLTQCGNFSYFEEFVDGATDILKTLKNLAQCMDVIVPIKFYSEKGEPAVWKSNSTMQHSLNPNKNHGPIEQEITKTLFNFEAHQHENTYFGDLNRLLRKGWDETLVYAQDFYNTHHSFFLSEDKIAHHYHKLLNNLYETYLNMQNQCETRSIRDTKEYLFLAGNYLVFLEEYIEVYIDEYDRQTLRNFEQFFDTEIKQKLLKTQSTIRNQYAEMQKKLKPLHGHPNNRLMLENLQIEAENIYSESKELVESIKEPYVENLGEELKKDVTNYFAVQELIPEVSQEMQSLKMAVDDLDAKLNEKVDLLKAMVNYSTIDSTSRYNHSILGHCKSFLIDYDSRLIEYDQTVPTLILKNENGNSIRESLSKDTLSNSTASSNRLSLESGCSSQTDDSEFYDPFLTDLKEKYNKYCKEVENMNFEELLETLRLEWSCAVSKVLSLYTVKYDQL